MLGDRTQAPSGAGFALENRIATARVFPDFLPGANVQRLRRLLPRLPRRAERPERGDRQSRVGILTPGPANDTYFEHAYIARYLGFMLLEGEDLTVENGRLMVRTVAGPQPDLGAVAPAGCALADPLELDAPLALGTPGLVGAIRAGR